MKEGKGSFSCVAALLQRVLVNTTAHDASQRGNRVVQPLIPTLATPFNTESTIGKELALMGWLLCIGAAKSLNSCRMTCAPEGLHTWACFLNHTTVC